MKKKILMLLVMLALLFTINQTYSVVIAQETDKHIIVEIGSQKYDAILTNEDAASEFYGKLPLTFEMSELNGNEKYNYMTENYSTNAKVANTIENGDIKLYGSSCMVLFYKTFSSGYSYTDIGKITNPEGLAEAVGQGDVSITFKSAQVSEKNENDSSIINDDTEDKQEHDLPIISTDAQDKEDTSVLADDKANIETDKKEFSENNNIRNEKVPSSKVKLNYNKKNLVVGDKITLKLIGNSKKVKWSSSKKTVAIVDANGKVTAKKQGKTVITAKVGKKKYKCEITVKKNVTVVAKVGKKKFYITMYNNKAAKQFIKRLPMKIKMSELNGNEKYYYMNQSISTSDRIGGKIKEGDFRLYDGACLVWFYKPFTTSYKYTKLGYIKNPNGLKKSLASKNVMVQFSVK
ncbi:MAG: cyclophilin-like fold protein [Eubacteriales bacterium]|nr:cyclophilin-like fold protein [Eubacteriales bacterium]